MCEPRYQEIAPEEVPEVAVDGGGKVRVIAGSVGGTVGPISGVATDPTYLDVALPARTAFAHDLPVQHNAFVYVFEGSAEIGNETLARGRVAVLSQGERIEVSAPKGGRFILVAGRPLGEPVAKYGPFVMNTVDELRQAVADFQSGKF
jgi:redox-sensitive bicupin YhaK (pirin superfamily)